MRLVKSETHSGVALWGEQCSFQGEPVSYRGHLVIVPADWGLFELYRRGWASGSVSGNWLQKDDGKGVRAGTLRILTT